MMPHVSFSNLLIVAAIQIGGDLGIVGTATNAAFVAAALLSVLLFPLVALTLLRRDEPTLAMERAARLPAES